MRTSLASMMAAGAMVVALALVGCGGQQSTPTTNETPIQEQTTGTTDQTGQNDQTNQTAQISEEEAKRIAFEDAGVSEQDVTLLSVYLDTDDGVTKYEVDFNVGQTEYDYDIDSTTGAILERNAEVDND